MAQFSALETSVTALAEQVGNLSGLLKAKAESEAKLEASLVEIKNQIKGKHTPPTQRVNEGGLSPAEQYLKRK